MTVLKCKHGVHRKKHCEQCHPTPEAPVTADPYEVAVDILIDNNIKAPRNSLWLHVKTQKHYKVSDHVLLEDTLEPAVVYHPDADVLAISWCRPHTEFFDGRFTLISAITGGATDA